MIEHVNELTISPGIRVLSTVSSLALAIQSSTHGGLCWPSPTVLQQTDPWMRPPQGWKPLQKFVHIRVLNSFSKW